MALACFSRTHFCHQSGRQWPDLDDTLGFESWSFGPHFRPIPGPRGGKKIPKKIQKLFGKILKFLEFWSHVFKPGGNVLHMFKALETCGGHRRAVLGLPGPWDCRQRSIRETPFPTQRSTPKSVSWDWKNPHVVGTNGGRSQGHILTYVVSLI